MSDATSFTGEGDEEEDHGDGEDAGEDDEESGRSASRRKCEECRDEGNGEYAAGLSAAEYVWLCERKTG